MINTLEFSFLPLINSNFSFTVYRRAIEGTKGENEYKYNLPLSSEQKDIRDDFYVSFILQDNCIMYECNSFDNIYLTLKWLTHQLIERTHTVIADKEYKVGIKFIPRISYIISKTQYGDQVIDVEPYYLKITKEFGFTVDFRFSANERGKNTVNEKILSLSLSSDGQKNRNFYSDKYWHLYGFIHSTISKLFPIEYSVGSVDTSRNLKSLPYLILKEKQYIFNAEKISSNQFSGLSQYKPFQFVNKKPLYIFIFQKNRINISRELVKALRGESYSTFSGMQKMFGLEFSNDKIVSIQVDDFNQTNLESIEGQVDKYISSNPNSQIVGIFAGIQKDFDFSQTYSPYYIIKNMFLKKGLAVQAVTIEQAQKRDGLKWSISGIGLQLFVKLGGMPWKVAPQNDNCLIFGISSAHLRNADGSIRKYYAYSVCFDSSGLYKWLDILSTSNSRDSYLDRLKTQVSQTLQNRLTNEITKCAIHVPFKLRKDEMRCIKECINDFKQSHGYIEVVFVKINVDNRFFGYSEFNSKVPLSGSYIELSDREFLVWFEGLQQGKEHLVTAQAVTNPVHIEFLGADELSADQVKGYLQDIINLSGANWRGYNAKHTPVSIYYPELIAKFIGRFDQYGLELNLGLGAIDKAWFV